MAKNPTYDCSSCRASCCRHLFDNIHLSVSEARAISEHMGYDMDRFLEDFVEADPNGVGDPGRALMFRKIVDEKGTGKPACPLLDLTTNQCTVYEVRPSTCREFPVKGNRCTYYDFLADMRKQQDDPNLRLDITFVFSC